VHFYRGSCKNPYDDYQYTRSLKEWNKKLKEKTTGNYYRPARVFNYWFY